MNDTQLEELLNSQNVTLADIDTAVNQDAISPNMLFTGIEARETSTGGWN